MQNNPADRYALYRKLHALPEDARLRPFEEFLSHSASYDAIEFSQKFSNENGVYRVNPLRYTLWKYKYDSERDRKFLEDGLNCFRRMTDGTPAEQNVARFAGLPLQRSDAELRYICMGLEMHEPFENSRLKLYAGFRLHCPPSLPFICRAELNLKGAWKTDTYQGIPLENSKIRVLTRGWPEDLIRQDVLFFAYAQAGRIHFKIGSKGAAPVLNLLWTITGNDDRVRSGCRSMLDNDFRFWVLTLREQEMLRNEIRNFTVYYR